MPFGMIPLTNHHSSDVTVRSLTVILVHPEGITVYIAIARFVTPLQHCLRTAQLGAAGGMYGKVSQRKEGNLHLGLSAVISQLDPNGSRWGLVRQATEESEVSLASGAGHLTRMMSHRPPVTPCSGYIRAHQSTSGYTQHLYTARLRGPEYLEFTTENHSLTRLEVSFR